MIKAWIQGLTASLLLAGAAASQASATAPQVQGGRQLVVVELFESQGCSSCPPANANVNALSTRADVLTLIYGVTYWDQLGWRDTFARPEFTQRQRDYARGLGNDNVYTPQVVLNGSTDLVGNNRAQLEAAIGHAATRAFAARVTFGGEFATVTAESVVQSPVDVWLVRYDPRSLDVPIRAGENSGRTLPHIHVVRVVTRLGSWDGTTRTYPLPHAQPPLRTAVLVQMRNGGAIIGAATAPAGGV